MPNDYNTLSSESPPADCLSITGFYERAPATEKYYSFVNLQSTSTGYIPYFRVFIPPGTVLMDLNIIETGKQMAVARYMSPPTGLPNAPPEGYTPDNYFTLSELAASDHWIAENSQDSLYIASDGFTPPLEINKAGWLYVKVGGGQYSSIYDTHFSARVDTDIYNNWWDKYIKNESGWNKNVQQVLNYVLPPESHETYKMNISGIDIKIVLFPEIETVNIVVSGYPELGFKYTTWIYEYIKTILIPDLGYIQVIGTSATIYTNSGFTLELSKE